MENGAEYKNYEFAYHLGPDFGESQIQGKLGELESIISESGGSVLFSQEPKKTRLSYPINHNRYSFFGHFDFSAEPEALEKISSRLKLQPNLMRYMVIKKPQAGKVLRAVGETGPKARQRTPEAKEAVRVKAQKPKTEVSAKEMEKEIEDVLEKI